MIARSKRMARVVFGEYRRALAGFSPNARLFLVSLVLSNMAIGMLVTVFGIYVKTAGMSEAVVGDVEGAVALSAAVVCLAAAPLVGVLGYRRILIAAAGFYAIARLGQAAFPVTGALLAFGLVSGMGEGVMQSAATAFLSENSTPKERAHLYSIDLFVRVGSSFGGGIVGGLLPMLLVIWTDDVTALRSAVGLAGLLLAASAAPLMRLKERRHPAGRAFELYRETVRDFSSWGHVWRLVVPQSLISLGAGMVIPFLSLYLKEQLGASLVQVGAIQGVSALAMGTAALAAPFVGRRLGLVRGTVLTEALSLPFLAVIPFVRWLPLAALAFWARSALMNMSWPLWSQYTMEGVPSRERPLVSGAVGFAWSVSWFAGSVIGGRLMLTSYALPYAFTSLLYIAGVMATWLLLGDREVRPGGEPVMPETVAEEHRGAA